MLFAARLGDLTGHGTPLVYLAPPALPPNVFIGGKPAWRGTADVHACPVVNGVVPHVGGAVLKGSLTVLINGLPAVRVGDMVAEPGGGPNPIAAGCKNVIIGG